MTIKTQGGKVVTKDGKVSCECCDVECCMYPAEGFSAGSYSVEDLPDEILIAGVLAQKQQDGYPRYTSQNEEFTVTDPDKETPPEDALWQVMIFGESFYELNCLISSYKGSAELGIEDQFADTYTVSGPISGTVTRESVCVWRGSNLRLTNFGFQWKVNGNNKTGLQNTPVGSYAGGYSVS